MKTIKTIFVREAVCSADYGKIIRTRSEKFGEGTYLIAKYPGKYFEDKTVFVKLPYGDVLFWDSMKNDEVLEIREANL